MLKERFYGLWYGLRAGLDRSITQNLVRFYVYDTLLSQDYIEIDKIISVLIGSTLVLY
jgi:hypothetical protein